MAYILLAIHKFVLATALFNKEMPLKKSEISGLTSVFRDLCIFTSFLLLYYSSGYLYLE